MNLSEIVKFLYTGWHEIPNYLRTLCYVFGLITFYKFKEYNDFKDQLDKERKDNMKRLA